jgi:hypothetical protein
MWRGRAGTRAVAHDALRREAWQIRTSDASRLELPAVPSLDNDIFEMILRYRFSVDLASRCGDGRCIEGCASGGIGGAALDCHAAKARLAMTGVGAGLGAVRGDGGLRKG